MQGVTTLRTPLAGYAPQRLTQTRGGCACCIRCRTSGAGFLRLFVCMVGHHSGPSSPRASGGCMRRRKQLCYCCHSIAANFVCFRFVSRHCCSVTVFRGDPLSYTTPHRGAVSVAWELREGWPAPQSKAPAGAGGLRAVYVCAEPWGPPAHVMNANAEW